MSVQHHSLPSPDTIAYFVDICLCMGAALLQGDRWARQKGRTATRGDDLLLQPSLLCLRLPHKVLQVGLLWRRHSERGEKGTCHNTSRSNIYPILLMSVDWPCLFFASSPNFIQQWSVFFSFLDVEPVVTKSGLKCKVNSVLNQSVWTESDTSLIHECNVHEVA